MIKQLALFIGFLCAQNVIAESPEEKGRRIAVEADDKNNSFKTLETSGKMVLIDKGGKESERLLKLKILAGEKRKGDKNIMIFSKPKDIKGTALLTWVNPGENNDQWIYLPSLKRVKKISSSNQSGQFLASEFTYEDVSPRNIDNYKFKYLGIAPCGSLQCHKIQAVSVKKKSGYKKEIHYLDISELRIQKSEFYNKRNQHFKTSMSTEYKKIGGYWTALRVDMENLQTGKKSYFQWDSSKTKYDKPFSKSQFSKTALSRAR